MNCKYLIPCLRIIDLSSEGMVASSGNDAGGHGPDMPWGDNSDAGGHGSNMPWGSSKNETIWAGEDNTCIWK